MARLVTTTQRTKQVFNITLEEFKKGEWLSAVPDSDMAEVSWKQNYLTIGDFKIKRTQNGTEKEQPEKDAEEDNGTEE